MMPSARKRFKIKNRKILFFSISLSLLLWAYGVFFHPSHQQKNVIFSLLEDSACIQPLRVIISGKISEFSLRKAGIRHNADTLRISVESNQYPTSGSKFSIKKIILNRMGFWNILNASWECTPDTVDMNIFFKKGKFKNICCNTFIQFPNGRWHINKFFVPDKVFVPEADSAFNKSCITLPPFYYEVRPGFPPDTLEIQTGPGRIPASVKFYAVAEKLILKKEIFPIEIPSTLPTKALSKQVVALLEIPESQAAGSDTLVWFFTDSVLTGSSIKKQIFGSVRNSAIRIINYYPTETDVYIINP